MGNMSLGALAVQPWKIFGVSKHVSIFVPMMLKVAYSNVVLGQDLLENTWFHLLLATALRYVHIQLWTTATRVHGLVKNHKIQKECRSFEQMDREAHWDDLILLQLLVAACMVTHVPQFNEQQLPLWDGRGALCLFLLHAGPTEYIYYWCHRMLHESGSVYKSHHALHHTTSVPDPTSAFVLTFAEQLAFTTLVFIPLLGVGILGMASAGMFYCYWFFLDLVSAVGHSNWEFVPVGFFTLFPALKFFIITPTYHLQHHREEQQKSNYCFSFPLYDYLGGTFNKATDSEHERVRRGVAGQIVTHAAQPPDHVFLVHGLGHESVLHLYTGLIGLHANPFQPKWYYPLFMPITIPIILALWAFGTPYVGAEYSIDEISAQTWVMPRFGFQYFIRFGRENINEMIENAIVEADKMGTKVLALGALNKMEELNEGGLLFLKRQPNLRMRLCHGNTLTAGVILNGLPTDVHEIFLTGATSKLGRAVSLYLATHGVRVLMLTASSGRVEAIIGECPEGDRHNLVHVTKYQDAQHCKTWVLGKQASARDQKWAPPGTTMHQFVVPKVPEVRKDCSYGALAAMHLPKQAKGMDCCEHSLDRDVVHACHAGGMVHLMEGWTHHEMGSIPIGRIETVWIQAMKHGFRSANAEGGFLDSVCNNYGQDHQKHND